MPCPTVPVLRAGRRLQASSVAPSCAQQAVSVQSVRPGRRTNGADELHLDARVLEPLAVLWPYRYRALDRLSVHIQRCLLAPVLVQLDIHH